MFCKQRKNIFRTKLVYPFKLIQRQAKKGGGGGANFYIQLLDGHKVETGNMYPNVKWKPLRYNTFKTVVTQFRKVLSHFKTVV